MCLFTIVLSIDASYISYALLFLTQHALQASLLLILKIFFFFFLKMLVPYPDFYNVHLGYASKLQVCN